MYLCSSNNEKKKEEKTSLVSAPDANYAINYIKCIPFLPFNYFQLAIKCGSPQAKHI